jgi:hypothetical protein
MLREIRTGVQQVDAILVDTWERFGRADELSGVRDELWRKHGVIVLTANSRFSDPTSESGKVVGMFEQARATTINDIKAHDVFRGKVDMALRKRWPGAHPPIGKRLSKRVVNENGREVIVSDLVPDPEGELVVRKLFFLAKETGRGMCALAKMLNADPDIPARFKPMRGDKVAYILQNPIYIGELRWAHHSTGVVNDVRVMQKNPESEVVRVPDFCPPIISREDWDVVQALRQQRSQRILAGRARNKVKDVKQLQPLAPGMTLKYLLTGLVFCAHCGARMAPCSSIGASTTGKRLAYYRCLGRASAACINGRYVREDLLRKAVIGRIRAHLFPVPVVAEGTEMTVPPWLGKAMDRIGQDLRAMAAQQPDPGPALQQQIQELQQRMAGWTVSLGKSDLPAALRHDLETQYAQAAQDLSEVQQKLAQSQNGQQTIADVLDVRVALERLRRLDQVLAGGNVTAGNLELSLHIDRIDVFADGRVRMHTSKLGIFEGAVELLAQGGGAAPAAIEVAQSRVISRRRNPLRLNDPQYEESLSEAEKLKVTDSDRFTGLDPKWFWHDVLDVRPPQCWSTEHAQEVAALHRQDPKRWTNAELAKHFGKTPPTIRLARRRAAEGAAPALPASPAPPVPPAPPEQLDRGETTAA